MEMRKLKLTKRGEVFFNTILGASLTVMFASAMFADGDYWQIAWKIGMLGGAVSLLTTLIIHKYE